MPDEEEVVEEEETDDTEEDEEDDIFEVSDDEDEDEDDESEEDEEEEPEKKDTDSELKELGEIGDKIKSATTHYEQLSKAIKEAQGSLHNIRQEKKAVKSGEEEAVFTDAQLQNILEEHSDEPGVVLQVMKQMMKQGMSDVEESAAKKAETSTKQKEMDGYLTEHWPELRQDGSEIRLAVNETKGHMDLDDHPYGDFLATGAHLLMNVNDMIEKAKEEGRAEALKTKVETSRKDKIKSTKLTSTGKSKSSGKVTLSTEHQATAKQIGLNKRQQNIYARMLGKGRTIQAEV